MENVLMGKRRSVEGPKKIGDAETKGLKGR